MHVQELMNGFERAKDIVDKWTLNDTIMSSYSESYKKVYNQTIHLLRISISLSESFVNGILTWTDIIF